MADTTTHRNGLAVDDVRETAAFLAAQPEPATAVVRTTHRWEGGAAVEGHGDSIEALGATLDRTGQRFGSDLPEPLGGTDRAPAPTELLLSALAGCVASGFVEGATGLGIDIAHLEVTAETRLDLRGMYEVEGVRPGLDGVEITLHVDADADDGALERLAAAALTLSPTADSLANPVPLRIAVRT